MRIIKIILFIGIIQPHSLLWFSSSEAAVEKNSIFISLNGKDSNPGSIQKPVASLERARGTIRELKQKGKLPAGGITVFIRGGTYSLSKTFTLTDEDSGTEKAPIVYRSYNNEVVHLIGGKELADFSLVVDPVILDRLDTAARGKVLQINLKTQGITDFGEIKPRGMGKSGIPSALEFFFNGRPMTLARWPNIGWEKIASTPAGPKGGRFSYDGDRQKRWSKSDNIWLHGYWTWNWADSYVKVKSIDTHTREIITQQPHGVYGYKPGGRYYAFNILDELDEPGEWYLDQNTGILFFWPPVQISHGKAFASILPGIISLHNTSFVTIQGITIEYCRGSAVTISGGSNNRVVGCTIRNVGNNAVIINGGANNGVQSSDIYQCGESGVILTGGNRNTLTAAENYVVNNKIHDFSQWVRTYNPGIAINGVGNRIANNRIFNAPHNAILLHGNEHIIEYNEIYNVCLETSDAGAFYMGRDYSERGNIIRYNYFHNLNMGDVQAIYLDDFASGTTVFGNVVYKAGRGVMIGGGRDNNVRNNIFIQCNTAIYVGARVKGSDSQKYFNGKDSTLTDRLAAVKFREPPYSIKYPELFTLFNGDPAEPKGNSIVNNISYVSKWLDLETGLSDKNILIEKNFIDVEPGFVDAINNNFQLKNSSYVFELGFKRIPMNKIGIFVDKFRKRID